MKIYHHNDADGRCAAAVAWLGLGRPDFCETIEMDYKDSVELSEIGYDEQIFIVDFSFKPETMSWVMEKTKNIVWIDHHKTAFEYDYGVELAGLRSTKGSGCELAWDYFLSIAQKEVPEAVKLIGDRDTWTWKHGDRTANFCQGLRLYDHGPKAEIWKGLIPGDTNTSKVIEQICDKGRVCIQYRDSLCKDYRESHGFETEFEGYKCFANGIYMFGSEAFGPLMDEYDICLPFEFNGKTWTVGLYSTTVDVSVIAKKHGGGGHTGAAGFVCNELPFKRTNT